MRRLVTVILALMLTALPALAQDRATLVADSVTVQSGSTLVASGHVEVFYRGQRLTAQAITYDQTGQRLTITGPIRIQNAGGDLFLARQAELSADLTEGLLTSARLVLNQQLQLAAAQIQRTDGGNLTAMRNVVASSCTICAGNPTPLWEIRAREVVHDAAAQQIFFTGASLRFYGVPVLYVPRLRVPDPGLKRATGFLLPKLRSTTALGTGLQMPYFIAMGKSRDLTLTPFLTNTGNQTLSLRFRQALATGTLEVTGAVSRDDLGPDGPRGYLMAKGDFALGNAFRLGFSGISVSDDGYLADYGVTSVDRLESQVAVFRVVRDLAFSTRVIGIQSVREGDSNSTSPTTISDIAVERRFDLPLIGGAAGLDLDIHSDYRSSVSAVDQNGDGVADGRDLRRISLAADWTRNWTTSGGLVLTAAGIAGYDGYAISQDAEFGGVRQRLSGAASVDLRWPLVKSGGGGVSQVIEPVVQLVTSSQQDARVPNSDSTLVEFDGGNLYALDRYPGADAVEAGTRVNLGATYTRLDSDGWSLGMTAGRVVRLVDEGQFSAASGLDGQKSDWLLAWSLDTAAGLALTNRVVLADDLTLTKGEVRFDLTRPSLTLSGGYEYLLADASETRDSTASEIRLGAKAALTPGWSADVSGRYDLQTGRMAQAGIEVDFRNECIDMTLSLSRSYASSSSLQPSTDVGLSVELLGFGGGSAAGPSRNCRR